jgi:hypothetical protein
MRLNQRDSFSGRRIVKIIKNNLCTLAGQLQRYAASDSPTGSGHQRDTSRKPLHRWLPALRSSAPRAPVGNKVRMAIPDMMSANSSRVTGSSFRYHWKEQEIIIVMALAAILGCTTLNSPDSTPDSTSRLTRLSI